MTAPPFAPLHTTAHNAAETFVPGAFAAAGSQHTSPISPAYGGTTSIKRTLSQSSDSAEEGVEGNGCKRKAPGVKRACNECRQQKV